MNKWLIIPIIALISCNKMENQQIHILSINYADNQEITDFNLSKGSMRIEMITQEDFKSINEKMRFGLRCVKNKVDFDLSNEELDKKQSLFEIVEIVKIKNQNYKFFVDGKALENTCLHCKFERPDFILTNSYESDVFELKFNEEPKKGDGK